MNYYNYFTEIEEHFVRRRGKHLYVSPLDWSLMATWKQNGIPLHVALRGIDIAMESWSAKSHRSHSKVNSLFYCHDSVMEEYQRHVEAHLGESPEVEAPSATVPNHRPQSESGSGNAAAFEFITARISEIETLQAKHSPGKPVSEGLQRILARLRELAQDLAGEKQVDLEALERDLGILDGLLMSVLEAEIPPEKGAEWEQEAKTELKIYKKKLTKETYEKIRQNYLRGKVHAFFKVAELSVIRL